MIRFALQQRVRVVRSLNPWLRGKAGTVSKLTRNTCGQAWLLMDDPLPQGLVTFPEGHERFNTIAIKACQCELLTAAPSSTPPLPSRADVPTRQMFRRKGW